MLRRQELTGAILGAAFEVHSRLGPGLLESAYDLCLGHELTLRGIPFARQVPVSLTYKGLRLHCAYRIDYVIDQEVVVELKSVDVLLPIHEIQLATYLRIGGFRIGLLINFNAQRLKDGIVRRVL